jgi:hypothetical protein
MKRLIKFWSPYNDGIKFSDCSTRYELYPELVNDDASFKDLKCLAEIHGVTLTGGNLKGEIGPLKISHAVTTDQIELLYNGDPMTVYLGFITLPKTKLSVMETLNNKLTNEQIFDIINDQVHGVDSVGDNVDDGVTLVKSGWSYYHELPLLGYDLKHFESASNITNEGFHDDTSSCSNCGLYNDNDNGYTFNFRVADCELLGVACGCYDEFCESDNALKSYSNDTENPMSYEAAQKHEEKGNIKFIERFVGGMTDLKAGLWGGKQVRVSTPEQALEELDNTKDYIFTFDESGQFQSYFSVWEIL